MKDQHLVSAEIVAVETEILLGSTLFPSRTQPEPKESGERTLRFRDTIERFGRSADSIPFVCNTGPPPNGNIQEVFEVAAREYRALAEFAAERVASVALEPLSPALMNYHEPS